MGFKGGEGKGEREGEEEGGGGEISSVDYSYQTFNDEVKAGDNIVYQGRKAMQRNLV